LTKATKGDDNAEIVLVPAGKFWMGREHSVIEKWFGRSRWPRQPSVRGPPPFCSDGRWHSARLAPTYSRKVARFAGKGNYHAPCEQIAQNNTRFLSWSGNDPSLRLS
jgi:hypothetical protein